MNSFHITIVLHVMNLLHRMNKAALLTPELMPTPSRWRCMRPDAPGAAAVGDLVAMMCTRMWLSCCVISLNCCDRPLKCLNYSRLAQLSVYPHWTKVVRFHGATEHVIFRRTRILRLQFKDNLWRIFKVEHGGACDTSE